MPDPSLCRTVLVVCGHSGAGKTYLVRHLVGELTWEARTYTPPTVSAGAPDAFFAATESLPGLPVTVSSQFVLGFAPVVPLIPSNFRPACFILASAWLAVWAVGLLQVLTCMDR